MLHSLRGRLSLLFLAFLLLVIAAVTVTSLAVNSQRSDALLINLAGRQRMLSQQMTWLALNAAHDPALPAARARFEQTLLALRHGGPALDPAGLPITLPAPASAAVQAGLADAWLAWQNFAQALDQVLPATTGGGSAQDDAAARLTAASLLLVDRLDAVVATLSGEAQARVRRLQVIQAAFLLLALLLLWAGYRFTRGRVVDALALLGASAQRMAGGELEQSTPGFAEAELDQLAQALEAMRVEVLAGRRQLEARVSQRTRELSAAFEFSQEISAQLELEQLLESAAGRARALLGGTAAALCLLDDAGATLRLAAGSGAGHARPELRQPVSAELPSQVIGQGRTVVAETACASCGFLRRLPAGQCVATPLRAGESTLGALCVVRPATATFEPEEQVALALLANSAAVAIVNARLVEAGRIQAQEAAAQQERERLAVELHDNLAQTLSFLNFKAERIGELIAAGAATEAEGELAEMRGATTKAYGQVRAALIGLNAAEPEGSALASQLAACVAELRAATGLEVALRILDAEALALPSLAQQQALHIVREALINVWRHAAARQATVTVDCVHGRARFIVADDGRGFDPAAVDSASHLGLAIMRARAQRSGGCLDVHSAPGAGAQVVLTFAEAE